MFSVVTPAATRRCARHGESLAFDVTLSPRWWTNIGALRVFIGEFLRPALVDPCLADRVALAAHELLENALKYSATPDSPVRCRAYLRRGMVGVRVQNRTSAESIAVLTRMFELVQAGDPLETYLAMMHRSLANDLESQLGLARIRYETGASLRLDVDGDRVQVDAAFAIADLKGPRT